jgi:hypothetical protein
MEAQFDKTTGRPETRDGIGAHLLVWSGPGSRATRTRVRDYAAGRARGRRRHLDAEQFVEVVDRLRRGGSGSGKWFHERDGVSTEARRDGAAAKCAGSVTCSWIELGIGIDEPLKCGAGGIARARWSRLPPFLPTNSPEYWQTPRSHSKIAARVTRGTRSGMRSNWVETITVGTRTMGLSRMDPELVEWVRTSCSWEVLD